MSHGVSLGKTHCLTNTNEPNRMSKISYVSAIGFIMYSIICTRLNVSYALSIMRIHQFEPDECHQKVGKNILKYLGTTRDQFLVCGGDEDLTVRGYTDASFQTDKDDYRSHFGSVFHMNEGEVS